MNFFLVDDDDSIRAMLANIIEDEELGKIEGEAMDGSEVTVDLLANKNIDVLIIDLLMPNRDGIETIKEISPFFNGKIVMLSQVETKELIGEAYSLGIDYYITKPINKLEVVNILQKLKERILLENSINHIKDSLNLLEQKEEIRHSHSPHDLNHLYEKGRIILTDLGITNEVVIRDFLSVLEIMYEKNIKGSKEILSLKELFDLAFIKKYGSKASYEKEVKSAVQRVRRAVHQSLEHVASLGLADFSNPTFEYYASKFFDFELVRQKMIDLQGKKNEDLKNYRVNIKKFIQVLFMEVMKKN